MSETTNSESDRHVDPPKTKIPCEPVEQKEGTEKLGAQIKCFIRDRQYVLNSKELAPNPIAVLSLQVVEGLSKEEAQARALQEGHVHGISKLSAIKKEIDREARERQGARRPRARAAPTTPAASGTPTETAEE